MNISWHKLAWEEYLSFQNDKKTLKKINNVIKSIARNGYDCIGKPEKLTGNLVDYWSVRIDKKNRIVFKINENNLFIIQCGSHYLDK